MSGRGQAPENQPRANGKKKGCCRARRPYPSRGLFRLSVPFVGRRLARPCPLFLGEQVCQAIDMGAKPPRKGIDPLGAGDEKLKRRRGLDVCDADAKIGFFLLTACSTSGATLSHWMPST